MRALGGAALRRHLRAQRRGLVGARLRQRDRAVERRIGERARVRRAEAELARGLLERLEEVEHVGGPAAGDAGDRVEHRLASTQTTSPPASSTRRTAPAPAASTPAAAKTPLMPRRRAPACSASRARSARAAEPAREVGEADAGGDRQHDRARHGRAGAAPARRRLAHLLRLHREHDEGRAGDRGGRAPGVERDPGKARGELLALRRERLDDAESRPAARRARPGRR